MIQVLYSPQSRMVQGALKRLLEEAFPKRDALNFVTLDMAVTPTTELTNECLNLPLGCDKKAVVAENCSFLGAGKFKYLKDDDGGKSLLAYLENPDEAISLYLLVYDSDLSLRSPLYKALLKAGAKINPVSVFTKDQWTAYITKFFAKREVTISADAIAELSKRVDGDYATFLNESQKLLTYLGEGKEITLNDVKTLVSAPLEDDAYTLANALAAGDLKGALKIYRDLASASVDEVTLIHLLANQFRFLNEVRYLASQHLSDEEIGSTLFASPIRVRIARKNLLAMKEDSLPNALEKLYQCEFRIMTGQMSEDLAFSLYLATFSL
jgi:DNA polymerase-3 subunit delta